jgi:hypothetical protein
LHSQTGNKIYSVMPYDPFSLNYDPFSSYDTIDVWRQIFGLTCSYPKAKRAEVHIIIDAALV